MWVAHDDDHIHHQKSKNNVHKAYKHVNSVNNIEKTRNQKKDKVKHSLHCNLH